MAANLLVIQGADEGTRFELSDNAISLGRGVQNELRLNDAEVSRIHVYVEPNADGGYVLIDKGSANGTLVNGQSVSTHRLKTGDQIQVGRSVLVFDSGGSTTSQSVGPGEQVQFVDAAADASQIVNRLGADETQTFVRSELADVLPTPSAQMSPLQTLFRVSEEAANATASIEHILQSVLDLALAATQAERGCVLLVNEETEQLSPASFSARHPNQATTMSVSRTIVNHVASQRQGVRTSDAQGDSRFASGHSIIATGIVEAICVPMMGLADFIGVIYLHTTSQPDSLEDRFRHRNTLTDQHLKLVMAIGRQVAIAIERRRYQQALLKAERFAAVGQTITMLSHHVKNILQGVRGGSYLIETGLGQNDYDVVKQGWGIVDRNQDRIYNLVMDMLAYGADKKPALADGCVNDVVSEVCELMNGRATECSVTLRFDPHPDIPTSAFDSHGIHRAVLNIVTNAIEAVEDREDATVSVKTESTADGIVISVHDNGPGIPPDQKESLFSLFESTKGSRGTGLGLAVSRKIMEEHGGRIELDSPSGGGTTFRLHLPRIEPAEKDRPTQIE